MQPGTPHLDAKAKEFTRFLQLPAEVRCMIWVLCLPDRVEELDVARGHIYYVDRKGPPPCSFETSSYMNVALPLIAQVCHEA
jgi:hypothetical protein